MMPKSNYRDLSLYSLEIKKQHTLSSFSRLLFDFNWALVNTTLKLNYSELK
ncbi:Uncharacterised protein [Streptococcus pneumoniae]|nr:Uncharacterised protein [Streptococcus pneumoniae]